MRYQAITQIVMVVISMVVIFTYLQPKFTEIQAIQEETVSFEGAVANAAELNELLRGLVREVDSFPQADQAALDVYLPNSIDSVMVARDLKRIAERTGMQVREITISESEAAADEVIAAQAAFGGVDPNADAEATNFETPLLRQRFSITVLGGYDQLQALLQAFEANAYPLQLQTLELSEGFAEGELARYSIIIDTFALDSQP